MITNPRYNASTWTLQINFHGSNKDYSYYNMSPYFFRKFMWLYDRKYYKKALAFLQPFSDKSEYWRRKRIVGEYVQELHDEYNHLEDQVLHGEISPEVLSAMEKLLERAKEVANAVHVL